MCDIIKIMPQNGYSQILHISLKTEKIFYRPPLMPAVRCCPCSRGLIDNKVSGDRA